MKAIRFLIFILLPLAITACSGSNDSDEPNVPVVIDLHHTIESCEAATYSIKFDAPNTWRAASSASWCKATPVQGPAGENFITFDIEKNNSSESRTCSIEIQTISDAFKFLTVNIEQPGKEAVEVAAVPVQATMPAAKKLYAYLREVYGSKTLSSTIANVNWNISEAQLVHDATGKWPAIATFDYIHLAWSPANWIDYSNTQVAEDWWNAGGIVSACWHWNVPCTEDDIDDLENMTCTPGNGKKNADGQLTTTFLPSNIFIDGTWEKRFADESLAKIADMLLLLKAKGIPVIWRPLHEAAGNTYADWNPTHKPMAWFWWGRDGAETYVKLWRYMFDYFAARGLDNLIWVFTGDMRDTEFYPGDEYVDIVGCDIYNQQSAQKLEAQYSGVSAIYSNKMVTLSEMGNVSKISDQWKAGATWLYFMPWYQYDAKTLDGHQHADKTWWIDAMNQDFVVTRDDLPSFAN